MTASTVETEQTKHSIDDVEIVLNPAPDGKEWRDILEWSSRTEGWAFAFSDYQTWVDSFEQFWYWFAVDKATKEAVGSLCLSRSRSVDGDPANDIYAVGIYYVRPDYRGCGLGTKLFDLLVAQAGNHNKVLNGVLKMAPLYAGKYGFDKFLPGEAHPFYEVRTERLQLPPKSNTIVTKDISEVDFEKIHAYDSTKIMPGVDRKKYLKGFLECPESKAGAVRIAFKGDDIVGICCMRTTGPKLSLGPFYAESLEIAETLMHDALNAMQNWREYVSVGAVVPWCNTEASKLFTAMNQGEPCGKPFTWLQFTKKILPAAQEQCYAIMECALSYI